MRILLLLLTITLLCLPQKVTGQSSQFTLTQKETFRITGDSNVRAWQAEIQSASGVLTLSSDELGSVNRIEALSLSIQVDQILSESNVLNGTMHNSLKSSEHPQITFTLQELISAEPEGDGLRIQATGVVHAAGVNHPVTMNVRAQEDDGTIRFEGSHSLLMSDFDIEPPTAMMGMFRAADEIEILFDLIFESAQP